MAELQNCISCGRDTRAKSGLCGKCMGYPNGSGMKGRRTWQSQAYSGRPINSGSDRALPAGHVFHGSPSDDN
ncbi:MAG: hypothetical protein AB7K24_15065 [Gemmataceae bacterium]